MPYPAQLRVPLNSSPPLPPSPHCPLEWVPHNLRLWFVPSLFAHLRKWPLAWAKFFSSKRVGGRGRESSICPLRYAPLAINCFQVEITLSCEYHCEYCCEYTCLRMRIHSNLSCIQFQFELQARQPPAARRPHVQGQVNGNISKKETSQRG